MTTLGKRLAWTVLWVVSIACILIWIESTGLNKTALPEDEPIPIFKPPVNPNGPLGMIGGLKSHPMGYRLPEAGKLGEPFSVEAIIDLNSEDLAALRSVFNTNSPDIRIEDILVTENLKLELSGYAFQVEPIRETQQRITPYTQTIWEWRVTPTEPGRHYLSLVVYDADAFPLTNLKQVKRRVDVTAGLSKWFYWLGDNFIGLFGIALGFSGITFGGIRRARRRKPKSLE